MDTALLVLRIIPGLVLMGHGLQKLVLLTVGFVITALGARRRPGAAHGILGVEAHLDPRGRWARNGT